MPYGAFGAVQALMMVVFSFQGLAVVSWFLKRRRFTSVGRGALLTLSWILFPQVLSWVGIADQIIHFRRFRILRISAPPGTTGIHWQEPFVDGDMRAEERWSQNETQDPPDSDEDQKGDEP